MKCPSENSLVSANAEEKMRIAGLLAGVSIMVMLAGCAGAPKPPVSKAPDRNQVQGRASHPDDRPVLENVRKSSPPPQTAKNYDDHLRELILLKPDRPAFNLRIWTGKNEYEIGDDASMSVQVEKDSYLTLLDIDSNGNVTVLFPNECVKENFIKGGVTYSIPGELFDFDLGVAGPPGLSRIKAIATLKPGIGHNFIGDCEGEESPLRSIARGETPETKERGRRDIKDMARDFNKTLAEPAVSGWAEAMHEIVIFEKGEKE